MIQLHLLTCRFLNTPCQCAYIDAVHNATLIVGYAMNELKESNDDKPQPQSFTPQEFNSPSYG